MIENWVPEDLPILLMSRSLLSATKSKPYEIGRARVMDQDVDALMAFDKSLERYDAEELARTGRYEAEADWVEDITGLPYQISYYFPSNVRNNSVGAGTYGAPDMTFSMLYEELCDCYNGGRRFIEDYFLSAFQAHMAEDYAYAVQGLKQEIADEANRRRRQHKAYWSNFETWSTPKVQRTFRELAVQTKKDIIASLASGMVPLNRGMPSEETLRRRAALGIASDQVFYATGRLIKSIVVSVILLDEETGDGV